MSQDFRIQLDRAHEHLETFNKETQVFIDSKPQHLITHLQPKGNGEYEVIVKIGIDHFPPLRLSVLAGEIVHHLHSSLDYLIYELSVFRAIRANDLRSVEFPIFSQPYRVDGRTGFSDRDKGGRADRRSGLHKIRFVQPGAQAIIKSLQPYKAGQDVLIHPLWVLQELSNIEKHRRLHLMGNPIGGIGLSPSVFGSYEFISGQEMVRRPLKDGAIIYKARIRELPGFQRKVRVKEYVPPRVSFEESIALPKKYAAEILQEILLFIENTVIPQLSPFLR